MGDPAPQGKAEVRRLLDEFGLRPNQAYGQNFLLDPNVIQRIVRLAAVGPGFVVPVRDRDMDEYRMERYDLTQDGPRLRLLVRGSWGLRKVPGPVNLLATPTGIVAASRRHVVFYRWEDW